MQSQTPHFTPRKQTDTVLSAQRRKFVARQRAEQDDSQQTNTSPICEYNAIDRMRQHVRKNLSGKATTAVRPRRRSKLQVGPSAEMPVPHANSTKMHRRQSRRASLILREDSELKFLTTSGSSLGSHGRSDRRTRRKRRTNSIVLGKTSSPPAQNSSPRCMRRRSAVATTKVTPRAASPFSEDRLISDLNTKFGLGW
ncbi:expressed unknown protein [Seminavis robusta]|uniref:Uncharacterized protein n=1 Tax=Seminavis robusta TaxID=568900 RepID=A0A9N8HVH8_9STRA|nr:expressed unknown protein [Seminavis robusta]|eukprot:Sro1507_g278350.1 n/a (197) ;mRNA; r:13537-14127